MTLPTRYAAASMLLTVFLTASLLIGLSFKKIADFVAYNTETGTLSPQTRPNILFIVSDDMRPQLGCYCEEDCPSPVHPKIHTPNLDSLASRSLLLRRAYVQQALCNPSRSSFLTSRRPDTTHVYATDHYFRNDGGSFVTIPQYFKFHGYNSIGLGKIFHPGSKSSGNDDPDSWSVPYYHPPNEAFWKKPKHGLWAAVDKKTYTKQALPDMQTASHATELIKQLATSRSSKPFFLAVGFRKPHKPFIFPEEFLHKYPWHSIRLPPNPYSPIGMPDVEFHMYDNLLKYEDMKKLNLQIGINKTFPDSVTLHLRRAYYCAISYIDSLIGQILGSLKECGLEKNTIIAFLGDHGYQIGEHAQWSKHTNFELATHAPMMLSIPGKTDHGIVSRRITEFVDLFPTLVEAAGFPSLPVCPANSNETKLCTEGRSLIPLLRSGETEWTDVAFSQYPRGNMEIGQLMGYSIRTETFRYTEWVHFHYSPAFKPDWTRLYDAELYDHEVDPQENYNRAHLDNYKEIRKTLSKQLRAGWRARQ